MALAMWICSRPVAARCPRNALAHDRGENRIVSSGLSRGELLRRGAAGGAAVVSGSLVGAFAGQADAATVPDNDLAYLRLLVAAELLEADLQEQALTSGKLSRRSTAVVKKTAADEKAHYARLAQLVTAAGQPPATSGDIDFSYPKGSLASQASVLKVAAQIETLVLGAYLGAIENVETAELRLPLGQIAANEAQHVSALAALRGRTVIGRPFPPSLQIDAASAALDRFES
ncbi:MAG TPA: ferritin-like domain-containing protein [Gaiellaceae bacterium]